MSGVRESGDGQTDLSERNPRTFGSIAALVLLLTCFGAAGAFRQFTLVAAPISVVGIVWMAVVVVRRGAGGLSGGEFVVAVLAVISAAGAAIAGVVVWLSLYAAPPIRHRYEVSDSVMALVLVAGPALLVGLVVGVDRQRSPVLRAASVVLSLTGLLGVVVIMLAPVEAREVASTRKTQCLANVKDLARALQMYAADYDRYPPAERWTEAISGYAGDGRAHHCPEAVPTFAYAYNASLDRVQPSAIPSPDRAISIFESDAGRDGHGGKELLAIPPRHFRGDNYGFADGHAKWVPRQAALDSPRQYLWEATKAPEPLPGRGHRGAGEGERAR